MLYLQFIIFYSYQLTLLFMERTGGQENILLTSITFERLGSADPYAGYSRCEELWTTPSSIQLRVMFGGRYLATVNCAKYYYLFPT